MEPVFTEATEQIYGDLPDVHREQDALQPDPGPLPALVAATNLHPNPSVEGTAGNGWSIRWYGSSGGSGVTTLKSADAARVGSVGVRKQWTTQQTAGSSQDTGINPFTPVEPGKTYSFAVSVRASIPQVFTSFMEWRDAGGTVIPGGAAVPGGTRVTHGLLPANTWQTVERENIVAPPTAVSAYLVVGPYLGAVTAWSPGDTMDADCAVTVEGPTVPDYFDGDTDLDDRYPAGQWGWNGTPHASSSFQLAHPGDPGGHPLKRYLSALGDQLDATSSLVDRFAYATRDEGGDPGDTSDLVDPWTADAAWLPWLGQLVGVRRAPGLSNESLRQAITSATTGFRAGNREAVGAAIKPYLTDTKYVEVVPFSIDERGNGGPWDLLVITRASETPGGIDVPGIIVAAGAKPAGVVLHHRAFSTTWADLHANRPTWASWNGQEWVEIEETGL
jgi:hypothetical protein